MPEAGGGEPFVTLDTVSVSGKRTQRAALGRGVCVGRYVVLARVGEGGMGVVYKAYDPELERPVALKLLHAADDDEAAAANRDRLLREAKALARLSHPNVLAVYDVGTFGADVFIATEFLEGATLREWLREAPRPRAEILRVMIAAGEGLAAAHRAGLVHRDFKPGNVIVPRDGRVRVLDFGLARAGHGASPVERPDLVVPIAPGARDDPDQPVTRPNTPRAIRGEPPRDDVTPSTPSGSSRPSSSSRSQPSLLDSPITILGEVVGTPRYMSPEQHAGGVVDARSDQFGFCVTLYEALYGEPPFDGSADHYDKNLREGRIRPPPPNADVPRWLRQVLVRGLATSPSQRYPDMEALLADLRRDAWSARRRWMIGASVVLLAIGGGAAARSLRDERPAICRGAERRLAGVWDDARKQRMRDAFAASGSALQGDAFARASAALDDYARRWTALRTDACEATRVRGEQSEELLDLRMACLDARLQQLDAQVDVLARADAKTVERAVSAVRALPPLDACSDAAALRAPVPPPSDPAARARVEAVRRDLASASALQRAGKYGEGLAIARKAASDAAAVGHRPLEAEALFLRGDLEDDTGEYATAEATMRRATAAAIAGRHDTIAARAFTALVAEVGLREARFAEAHEWAVLAEAAVERAGDPFVRGELPRNVGRILYREGKYAESRTAIERCLAIWEPALGPGDLAVAGPLTDLGNVFYAQGDDAGAIARYERSLAILEAQLGPEHPYLGPNLNNLGEVYEHEGELERALAALDRARAVWERSFGPDHPKVALAVFNLAQTRRRMGDAAAALPLAQRALAIWRKEGDDTLDAALGWNGLGQVLLALGRIDDARAAIERGLAIREKLLDAQHDDVADSLTSLGEARIAAGAFADAVAPLERALSIREARPFDRVALGDARFALAAAIAGRGKDVARAHDLATRARDAFASAHSRAGDLRAEAVDAWLAGL